jgi:hypothetical protein
LAIRRSFNNVTTKTRRKRNKKINLKKQKIKTFGPILEQTDCGAEKLAKTLAINAKCPTLGCNGLGNTRFPGCIRHSSIKSCPKASVELLEEIEVFA